MSLSAVTWAIDAPVGRPTAKLALICLADHADEHGQCFPSQKALLKRVGVSERALRDALNWLEEGGFIKRETRHRENGSRTSDSYSLMLPAKSAGDKRQNLPDLPAKSAPLTTFEPVTEPSVLPETSSGEPAKVKSKKRASYPELFESFWQPYPRSPNMSKQEAFDVWRKLDEADKIACASAVPGFVAFCRSKPDYDAIHACRFITKRRFEGFAPTVKSEPADDKRWTSRLGWARQERVWSPNEWGPPPGHPGCLVPRHLLEPSDGQNWKSAA